MNNNNKPIAQLSCYTPVTAQINDQERNPLAIKAQPLSLKELVNQRFPRNCSATRTQPQDKQGATQAITKQEKNCALYDQLKERIIIMAKRWNYTPEELKWALSQSKIKSREWDLVCTADEKLTCV